MKFILVVIIEAQEDGQARVLADIQHIFSLDKPVFIKVYLQMFIYAGKTIVADAMLVLVAYIQY